MILILILVVTALLLYIAHKWYSVWQYSEQFPGQPAYPIIGNGHLLGNTAHDYLNFIYSEVIRNKFEAFRVWFGTSLYVFIMKPEDVEIFVSSNKYQDRFKDYRFFHDWIGQGLVVVDGARWFRQRRLLTPAFHFKILNDIHPIVNSNINRLVEKLSKFADTGKSFDIQNIINLSTLDIICETAMGVQVNALDNPESKLVHAFHYASFIVYQRIFSPWKRYDWLFRFSKEYKENKKNLEFLHALNREVIAKRKQLLANQINNPDSQDEMDFLKKKKVFLDILLTSSVDGVAMTDEEISDEVSMFVFAGHDTTASAITFCLYNLAKNPKEQHRVYEEQLSIFGNDINRDPTYQELQEMQYTEMFIKESIRISPVVPLIGRHAYENITLPSGKIIPKGASVAIYLYAMGHNPKTFEDPMVFNPDRFLPENREYKNPYEFIPFCAGQRNCIGQKFATNEIRSVIAKIVRHFEILPSAEPFEPTLCSTSTITSANGIHIRLKRRPEKH